MPCLPTFSWSMDYLNTIYIEWICLGVELHNLMNISNTWTFRVEMFQLSLSVKSQLNVSSLGPKRFDSERKIFQDIKISHHNRQNFTIEIFVFRAWPNCNAMFYKTFICFYVSEAKPLCFSLCSRMCDDVERCSTCNIQNDCQANEQLSLCYFFSINLL